ncbi:sel1 repeat family protein [Helicobacter sp. MIT 14-3879]|nr:sel1 repeat family protein [Helicobacter sp. MIT 14-3879]
MFGQLSEEEWQYTYQFCMQENVNACNYLIGNGLVSVEHCYTTQCDTVAMIYIIAGRFVEALPYLHKSCEAGNMKSCSSLADTYYFYLNDYFNAKKYYEFSCNNKYSTGCYGLGLLYGKGQGVRQSFEKEDDFYKKACSGKESLGCYNLGVRFQSSTETKNYQSIAKEYYGKACDYGYQEGCDRYREFNEAGIK